MQNISANNFFWFWRCHYEFTNYFEVSNFLFSNVISEGVSTFKIISIQDQHFKKCKVQKIVKFSFLAFSADFFSNFVLTTYGTLKMFLLSAQNNFDIISSLCVEGHVKKNSSLNFVSLVGFQASTICMFFQKTKCLTSFEIISRQK